MADTPPIVDALDSPVAQGMAESSAALPGSFVSPFLTEGGPCNPAKRPKLKLVQALNTSTWWITKHEAQGFALQVRPIPSHPTTPSPTLPTLPTPTLS